jgi:hypothetical protein
MKPGKRRREKRERGAKPGGHKTVKAKEGRRLLWTLHFSENKGQWYYHNNKTAHKVWSAPDVDGWVKKEGSGTHRPYVGLKTYYFRPTTRECSYEVPEFMD